MRALLVVNPKATATTSRSRDVLASALGRTLKVDVAETSYRGHAADLAAEARRDAYDAVVALGGDGTVNEVVNGLLADGRPADPEELPRLAVVPGGSANVFSRALGFAVDPVEATSELLERLESGRERRLGLGLAEDRYFTFCAGLGLDADAVRRVELARARGRRSAPSRYVAATVRQFYLGTARHRPQLRLHRPDAPPLPIALGLVCNARPWTYLGSLPVVPCPAASFDTGLDLFALTRLPTVRTLLQLRRILSPEPRPRGRHLHLLHDQASLRISATSPQPFQVDGDFLGTRSSVTFTAVPRALRVIA